MTLHRITASSSGSSLSIYTDATITASATSRTLAGQVVRYGVHGRTSRGKLKVAPGALRFPDDLSRVKLTLEHDRAQSRGYLSQLEHTPDGIRAAMRVSDGPLGDAALAEALDKTRDGFSFDVVDATVVGDTITSALVIAIGQVGIPAFDDMRIDTIAASQHSTDEGDTMTPEQIARLAELRAKGELTDAERAELETLVALEAAQGAQASAEGGTETNAGSSTSTAASAPAAVTASAARVPAVPGGVPQQRAQVTERSGDAVQRFVSDVCAALRTGASATQITAALSDVTNGGAGANIEAPAWSGQLWSGLAYESEFTPLLNSGDLTSYEGKGWRFGTKPVMADYAGDKAAIPSAAVTTEPSSYEAARMAVGHDIDRKFYDFPNEAFLSAYVEAVRESWAMQLDAKVEAYIAANAVAYGAPTTSLLKAAALALHGVKKNTRARGTFVVVNDDDWLELLDVADGDIPAFLELFNVDPGNFVSSETVAAGTVIAGVKQAATVRTLPGSPIRVSAQHIANGGIDEAFFGYWAIEEHHASGIVATTFA